MFLAINFKLSSKQMTVRELVFSTHPPPKQGNRGLLSRLGRSIALFQRRGGSPVDRATAALAENRPAKTPPPKDSTLWKLWSVSAVWWSLTLAVTFVLFLCFGQGFATYILFGTSSVVYLILVLVTWRRIASIFPIEQRILYISQLLGVPAFAKGALGIKFAQTAGENAGWSERFTLGETDSTFVWAGVVIIICGFFATAWLHSFEKQRPEPELV